MTMESYLMMIYVTLDQESALKNFFLEQGWTFCKPDLSVTTDKVGPSVVTQIKVLKADTSEDQVNNAHQNKESTSVRDIEVPKANTSSTDTLFSKHTGKRKSDLPQQTPVSVKQPKLLITQPYSSSAVSLLSSSMQHSNSSVPQSISKKTQSSSTVTQSSEKNDTVAADEQSVTDNSHVMKAPSSLDNSFASKARTSPITVLGEDGKHFVIKIERESEELEKSHDNDDSGSDKNVDNTFNDDDDDGDNLDDDDDDNDESINMDYSNWGAQGDAEFNQDSHSSAGGSKEKCISSYYGPRSLQTTFHDQNLHSNNMSFAQFSEDVSIGSDAEKESSHTKRTVKRSVALFREFLGDNCTFEAFSKEELNVQLRNFFANIRKQDGSELKKSSLISVKYGITKYLKDICNTDIQNEPIFKGCLTTFKSKVTDLKKKGKGEVQHKLEITFSDLKKLSSPDNKAFCVTTPSGLQRKVWFDIMYYLCRKENLRSMTKRTFAVSVDAKGVKYLHQVKNETDRNNGDDSYPDDNVGEVRLYERKGDKRCPVKTFEIYLSKLHPELDALWQRPLEHFQEEDQIWYVKTPVGKNSLSTWMAEISQLAGLSHRYTNQCIRQTSTSKLERAGYEVAPENFRFSGYY